MNLVDLVKINLLQNDASALELIKCIAKCFYIQHQPL